MSNNRGQALVFFAGSVKRHQIQYISKQLKMDRFRIITSKQVKITSEEIQEIFIDNRTSIDIETMIQIGMINKFERDSITIILLSYYDQNKIYLKLYNLYKSYRRHKTYKNSVYFTLNFQDYLFKYQLLFRYRSLFYHEVFWDKMHETNKNYMQTMSHQNEQILNNFYDDFYRKLNLESNSVYIGCCCIPELIYKKYHPQIYNNNDVNILAKNSYKKSIERCGVLRIYENEYIPINNIMDVIWIYLGSVKGDDSVCKHCNGKTNIEYEKNNSQQPDETQNADNIVQQILLADGYNADQIDEYLGLQQLILKQTA